MATVKFNLNGVIVEMEETEVSKAIETGEVKIQSDELIVKSEDNIIYTKEELKNFEETIRKEEYNDTKDKATEIAMKAIKKASGLEFEGYKNPETFASTFKAKVIEDAKIAPDKKINDLTEDNIKLRENYETERNAFVSYKEGITEKETRTKKDNDVMSFFPTEGISVDNDIALIVLKNKAGIDIAYDDEGKGYLTKNGEMVKHERTRQPIEPKEFLESNLSALGLIGKPSGGSGKGDGTGDGKAGGYDAFAKEMNDKGSEYAEGTQAFAYEMNKRIGDKTLVM